MIETRIYKITAKQEELDILESLFHTMRLMGKTGVSRSIKLFVDGDGAFHPEIQKLVKGIIDTRPLGTIIEKSDLETQPVETIIDPSKDTIRHGYGYIGRNCDEFNGEGYYIYYDFG